MLGGEPVLEVLQVAAVAAARTDGEEAAHGLPTTHAPEGEQGHFRSCRLRDRLWDLGNDA